MEKRQQNKIKGIGRSIENVQLYGCGYPRRNNPRNDQQGHHSSSFKYDQLDQNINFCLFLLCFAKTCGNLLVRNTSNRKVVITIDLNAVPNIPTPDNELTELLNYYNISWRNELAEAARAAQFAIRTMGIADITVSSKDLANAMSKIKPIDYNTELHETTKALVAALTETKPLLELLQETLREAKPILKQIELETAYAKKRWFINLQLFAETLEEAALLEDDFVSDEPEECIDEDTADYLAAVASQVQTVFQPEQTVPFERLRNWIKSLSIEAKIALLSLLVQIIFGFAEQLPDPQITEQNNLIAEQNQILTGIWQEMQEYNDNLTPAPTPECTPTPTEQWLST